jgi:hypothetical protein
MLYTLIGNGNANKKEVLSSLSSLSDAVEEDEDFWMIFVDGDQDMSDTYKDIVQWSIKNSVPFEYVTSDSGDLAIPEWTDKADYCHFVKSPTAFTVKLTRVRPQPDEERAVLILSDDLDSDEEVLSAIEKFIDLGIPVYDLGNQMVEITFEEVPEEETIAEPLETPTAEDFYINIESSNEDEIDFTREDLMELNLTELKTMVQSRGLVPRDMRSKDSMIDVLMGTVPVTPEEVAESVLVQEPVQEYDTKSSTPVGRFYLVKIDADGKAEMRLLTAKQAALVY